MNSFRVIRAASLAMNRSRRRIRHSTATSVMRTVHTTKGSAANVRSPRRLAIDPKTILPILRLWRRAAGSHSPMRCISYCKHPSRHSQNWAPPEPAPLASTARPKLNQSGGISKQQTDAQRGNTLDGQQGQIPRGATRRLHQAVCLVLLGWPMLAPGLKAEMHSAVLRP